MVITVYKQVDIGGEEDNTQVLDRIEIPQIDSLSIIPVRDHVGTPLTAQYLRKLVNHLELPSSLQEDERYAQNVDTLKEGCVVSGVMDIPHHIGFRLAVNSILQKYGDIPNLLFQIS